MDITLFSSGFSELLLQLLPTTGQPANGIYSNLILSKMLSFVKLSPSNVISHTLEGISVPHLLPDKVPARRWSPTLVTDGRTLAVVNVDFSIPVPLTIVLETLKNDFKDLSNSLYLIPTQETTLQQYLNFHLPVDHSIWTCGKGRRVVQSCFEPSSSIV